MNEDESMTMTEELYYMIKARDAMENIPKEMRSTETQRIYNEIQNYIFFSCDHVFINDYIDHTPEKSGCITYCTRCLLSPR
jgi:hypothetical protein